MEREKYQKIYTDAKRFYFSIGKIYCSSLENTEILFNRHGWRHIFWKGDEVRPFEDRLRRFYLLKYAPKVIENGKIIHYREDIRNNTLGRFWRLVLKIGRRNIKVVIRQLGSGPKHFFSIMD